jgi:hypothetical protein
MASALYGGSGGQPFSHHCPSGHYVTGLHGRHGSWMNSIGITCSNHQPLGPSGGGKGTSYSRSCNNGYREMTVHHGHLIDALIPRCNDTEQQSLGAKRNTRNHYECSSGRFITGISGRSGEYLDAIRFHCGSKPLPSPPPPPATSSPPYGGTGGNPFSHQCPFREYVTNFHGRHGGAIDSIGIACSNSQRFGPSGGTGGTSYSRSCNNGFKELTVHHGNHVNAIVPRCNDTDQLIGSRSTKSNQFTCPAGQVVTGITGRSGSLLNTIRFHCDNEPLPSPSTPSPPTETKSPPPIEIESPPPTETKSPPPTETKSPPPIEIKSPPPPPPLPQNDSDTGKEIPWNMIFIIAGVLSLISSLVLVIVFLRLGFR